MPGLYTPVDLTAGTDLPVYLPAPVASMPAPSMTWTAETLRGKTSAPTWTSTNGTNVTMKPVGTDAAPSVGTDTKGAYLSFTGTQSLTAPLAVSSSRAFTMCIVARTTAATSAQTSVFGTVYGPQFFFGNAGGARRVYAGATLDGGAAIGKDTTAGWIMTSASASSATARIAPSVAPWTGNPGANVPTEIVLGKHTTSFSSVDIYRVDIWLGVTATAQQLTDLNTWATKTYAL